MKPLMISFIVALILSIVEMSSQEWAPVGAKWYYTPPGYGNCVYVESVKDTVVNEQQSKLLGIRYCYDDQLISNEIIQQTGDSIYFLHDTIFILLYNLSAKIGDTIEVYQNEFIPIDGFLHQGYPESISSFGYKIIGYDSIDIGGEWRKRQQTENLHNSAWKVSIGNYPFIIDGIGSMCYFFGRFSGIIPEELLGQLRCYSDEKTNWKNPSWNEDCDFLYTGTESPIVPGISLYPNPFSKNIRIEVDRSYQYFAKVYDFTGKLVVCTAFHNSVSIGENLQQGLYILKVETEMKQFSYLISKY
jgi:hypothetical protein